jgi:hypothetical protein
MENTMKSSKQNAMRIGKWIPALSVAALLGVSATSDAAPLILTLSGDVDNSSAVNSGTIADNLAATLNDPFAYDPLNPTSPLPVQTFSSSPLNGFEAGNHEGRVAYTLGGTYSGISFDLYGRALAATAARDNGLVLRLYDGDWITPVFTSAPFDIPDAAPWYTRYTTPDGTNADRVTITQPNVGFFNLMEIRAFVPEPSAAALLALGGLLLRRRLAGRWN